MKGSSQADEVERMCLVARTQTLMINDKSWEEARSAGHAVVVMRFCQSPPPHPRLLFFDGLWEFLGNVVDS